MSWGELWSLPGVPWPKVMEPSGCQAGCWQANSLPPLGYITMHVVLPTIPCRGAAVQETGTQRDRNIPRRQQSRTHLPDHRALLQVMPSRICLGSAPELQREGSLSGTFPGLHAVPGEWTPEGTHHALLWTMAETSICLCPEGLSH